MIAAHSGPRSASPASRAGSRAADFIVTCTRTAAPRIPLANECTPDRLHGGDLHARARPHARPPARRDDEENRKPNYLSVMNYNFGFGLLNFDGTFDLDYSRFADPARRARARRGGGFGIDAGPLTSFRTFYRCAGPATRGRSSCHADRRLELRRSNDDRHDRRRRQRRRADDRPRPRSTGRAGLQRRRDRRPRAPAGPRHHGDERADADRAAASRDLLETGPPRRRPAARRPPTTGPRDDDRREAEEEAEAQEGATSSARRGRIELRVQARRQAVQALLAAGS